MHRKGIVVSHPAQAALPQQGHPQGPPLPEGQCGVLAHLLGTPWGQEETRVLGANTCERGQHMPAQHSQGPSRTWALVVCQRHAETALLEHLVRPVGSIN